MVVSMERRRDETCLGSRWAEVGERKRGREGKRRVIVTPSGYD